jgi:hypothetical protein
MSATSITNVMTELFSAPLEAAVKAETQYRRIWADWMTYQLALATKEDGKELRDGVDLEELLKTAPVVSVDGTVELAITMRIAGVREFSGGLGVGLAIGPVYASGNFGFMSRTTEESVFQAQAKFTLSNTGKSLTGYLDQLKLTPAKPDEVVNAISELGKYMEKPKIDDATKAIVKS